MDFVSAFRIVFNDPQWISKLTMAAIVTAFSIFLTPVLIGLAGGYLWYSRLYLTNERRFWMAIENSMATQSVTRTLISGGSGNKVTQTQQFFFFF